MFKNYVNNDTPDIQFVHQLDVYDLLFAEFKKLDSVTFGDTMRIYGKLSSGSEMVINKFASQEFKQVLFGVLDLDDIAIVCDCLWVISNICLTSEELCLFMYDDALVDFLNQKIINMDIVNKVKNESLHVLRAIFTKLPNCKKIKLIVNSGIVESILMIIHNLNEKCTLLALKIFEEILKFFCNFSESK
jgi:hypothetical protein